jgi:hypothetical protein
MSDPITNLSQAVKRWRGERTTPTVEPLERNPYGAKIYQANLAWAETKKRHAQALEAERAEYLKMVEKYTEMSARWKAENPTQTGQRSGRPRAHHPDEIKILAARALREGTSKTVIRSLLGISDTDKLNTLLAEGEALLKAQGGR